MEKWIKKVAIVTGASSGIGKDISIRLVGCGLKVIGCGRNYDNLDKVNKEIPENSSGEFIPFKCDISSEKDVLSLFSFVETNYESLHICINNAGLMHEGSILHGTTENWKHMLDVNVLGLAMCTREAYKLMKRNETSKDEVPGHIINISSLSGHRVVPNSFSHLYAATKYAVTAISEATRQELREAKSNIRVSQISPGFVVTEFFVRGGAEEMAETMKQSVPNPLQPSDVSDAIIFALSASAHSTVNDILLRPTMQAN